MSKKCCKTCGWWKPERGARYGPCKALHFIPHELDLGPDARNRSDVLRLATEYQWMHERGTCSPSHWKAKPKRKPTKRRKR